MPGVHSSASEVMHLSRLSPEIPRVDILEHEPESQANNLFDMFGSQFSLTSGASFNAASSHDKCLFQEISFREQSSNGTIKTAAAAAAGDNSQRFREPELDSFHFLTRSMFDDKEKQPLLEERQLSPSSPVAPVAKLWTEYDHHHSRYNDSGGHQQQQEQASFEPGSVTNVSLKPNSSWGAGLSTSSAAMEPTTTTTTSSKPKRKRSRPCKSSEEVESQRMTHIAVERNRRKQMNEHLRVLRSLMPGSYVHRGDQASIIGGAIEFVKELQQLLQVLEEQKKRKMVFSDSSPSRLFSTSTMMQAPPAPAAAAGFPFFGYRSTPPPADVKYFNECEPMLRELHGVFKSEVAEVEVKIVDITTGFIKILCQRRAGQLLRTMVAIEHKLLFSIQHTNVTTIEHTVLYSFEVKIGAECTHSADDIAAFIHHTLAMSHNEMLEE